MELKEIWDYLSYCPKMGAISDVKRGIEWASDPRRHYDLLVQPIPDPTSDFRLGVPPQATPCYAFQRPRVAYLNFRKELQRRPESFKRPWDQPKVIVAGSRGSRVGPWKLAAFGDFDGLTFYRTFTGAWPAQENLVSPLAAVLNGPVANAFVTVKETGPRVVAGTISEIPVPIFAGSQLNELDRLVSEYREAVNVAQYDYATADRLLRKIDATVLEAYGLPARLEGRLLDFFSGHEQRAIPFPFADYFPPEFKSFFSLKDWLTGKPALATAERFRSKSRDIPGHIRRALKFAADLGREGDGCLMQSIADLPPPRAWWGRTEQRDALAELHRAYRDCPGLPATLRDSEFLRVCVARVLARDHRVKVWQAERAVLEFLRMTSLDP